MALNWQQRLAVVILALAVPAGAALTNQLAILYEGPGDLNEREAYFFQQSHSATYQYEGAGGASTTVTLRGTVVNATHTNVTVWVDGTRDGTFWVNPAGYLYEIPATGAGTVTGNYSPWWVFLANPMLGNIHEEGADYDLVDPTGFFGTLNQPLTLVTDRKFVYWPYEHAQDFLLGAQASIDAHVVNAAGDTVGTVILDATCGVVEEWHWIDGGAFHALVLLETTFPISRNRITMLMVAPIIGAIVFLAAAYLTVKREGTGRLARLGQSKEERVEILILLGTGIVATIMEIVDIWFYLPLGLGGNLLVHGAFFAWVVGVAVRQKYGLKWTLPAFLEIAFVVAMQFVDVAYVPTLTANMGSTLAWLALVWASGIEKAVDADATGAGKHVAWWL